MADVEQIALTEEQRKAWVWTVLAVAATDANRRAFLDGYNGQPCPKPRTADKLRYHQRGSVCADLLENPHDH